MCTCKVWIQNVAKISNFVNLKYMYLNESMHISISANLNHSMRRIRERKSLITNYSSLTNLFINFCLERIDSKNWVSTAQSWPMLMEMSDNNCICIDGLRCQMSLRYHRGVTNGASTPFENASGTKLKAVCTEATRCRKIWTHGFLDNFPNPKPQVFPLNNYIACAYFLMSLCLVSWFR